MTSPLRWAGRVAVLALTGLVIGTCDSRSPSEPGALVSITVAPRTILAVRSAQQFAAVGTDADGAVISISPVWSVVSGGGRISEAGLFTADAADGTSISTVMASIGGIAGTASVTVINGTVHP